MLLMDDPELEMSFKMEDERLSVDEENKSNIPVGLEGIDIAR